jgi:hypothetical protein
MHQAPFLEANSSLTRNYEPFIALENPISFSKEPATGPYPE